MLAAETTASHQCAFALKPGLTIAYNLSDKWVRKGALWFRCPQKSGSEICTIANANAMQFCSLSPLTILNTLNVFITMAPLIEIIIIIQDFS